MKTTNTLIVILLFFSLNVFHLFCNTKPFRKMDNLSELKQPEILQINKGELFEYKGHVHISVGYWVEYKISNPAVLRLKNTEMVYHNPEKMREGMTGGDAATKTFHFEAIAAGETELQILNNFRGDIESQKTWKIIVKD